MNLHITLIGSNPIPAYIGIKYLQKVDREDREKSIVPVPDKIMFIYSNGTKDFYESVKKELELSEEQIIDCNLYDDQVDGHLIIERIKEKLEDVKNQSKINSITLNNTGGTKPMAVYSTECIKEFSNQNKIKALEFYINPNSNKICINSSKNEIKIEERIIPLNKSLIEELDDIKLETILNLHKMELVKQDVYDEKRIFNNYIDLQNFVEFVTSNYEDYAIFSDLFVFNDSYRKERFHKKLEEYIKELTKGEFNLFIGDPEKSTKFKGIVDFYKESFDKEGYVLENLNINFNEKIQKKDDAKKTFKFLSGVWLEHYLYETILKIYGEKCKVYLSVEAQKEGRKCEIDIIVMKSYKMYIFSCTTSNIPGMCKQKAFEALYRAEQLGGEHSKVILVNMLDNKSLNSVRKDMSSFNAKSNKGIDYINKDEISSQDLFEERIRSILD